MKISLVNAIYWKPVTNLGGILMMYILCKIVHPTVNNNISTAFALIKWRGYRITKDFINEKKD